MNGSSEEKIIPTEKRRFKRRRLYGTNAESLHDALHHCFRARGLYISMDAIREIYPGSINISFHTVQTWLMRLEFGLVLSTDDFQTEEGPELNLLQMRSGIYICQLLISTHEHISSECVFFNGTELISTITKYNIEEHDRQSISMAQYAFRRILSYPPMHQIHVMNIYQFF